MKKMLDLVASAILLLTRVVSAADTDVRTIAEAWGPTANVSKCFKSTNVYGITSETKILDEPNQTTSSAGNSVSDIDKLVDIKKMSFGYSIKQVEVCEQINNLQSATSLIQSV